MVTLKEIINVAKAGKGDDLRKLLVNEEYMWLDTPKNGASGYFVIKTNKGYVYVPTKYIYKLGGEKLSQDIDFMNGSDIEYFRKFIGINRDLSKMLYNLAEGENKVENILNCIGTYNDFQLKLQNHYTDLISSTSLFSIWDDEAIRFLHPYKERYIGVGILNFQDCTILIPIDHIEDNMTVYNIKQAKIFQEEDVETIKQLAAHYEQQAMFIEKFIKEHQ